MAAALMAAGCDSDLSNSVTNTNTATTDYDSTVTAPVSTSSRSTTTTTTHTSATPTTGGAWVIVLDDALTTGVTTGEAAGGEFTESGYFLLSGAYLQYDTPCQQAIRVEFDAGGFSADTAAEKLILLQAYDLPHDEAAYLHIIVGISEPLRGLLQASHGNSNRVANAPGGRVRAAATARWGESCCVNAPDIAWAFYSECHVLHLTT